MDDMTSIELPTEIKQRKDVTVMEAEYEDNEASAEQSKEIEWRKNATLRKRKS